jgi:hypothetical protein
MLLVSLPGRGVVIPTTPTLEPARVVTACLFLILSIRGRTASASLFFTHVGLMCCSFATLSVFSLPLKMRSLFSNTVLYIVLLCKVLPLFLNYRRH